MSSWEEMATFSFQEEAQDRWVQFKYGPENRKKLEDDWREKSKLAENSKLLKDGKPNPHYPRLQLEADMAQTRFDMAFIVAKNVEMQRKLEMFEQLFERISILEGAYSHVKLIATNAKIDYDLVRNGLKKIEELTKSNLKNGG